MKLAVVGAGWAGLTAAVAAARAGARVTLFEASRQAGGRARALSVTRPDGHTVRIDNGQHILIGAYTETLGLLRFLGREPRDHLAVQPLGLPFADGTGLDTPGWATPLPTPLATLAAIAQARGWRWSERWALLRTARAWQAAGFACGATDTVAALCQGLPSRVREDLIDPLCVSALNLPAAEASAQVFLAVLRDALFGRGQGGLSASDLLLPRTDLGRLLPEAALAWLRLRVGTSRVRIRLGERVESLTPLVGGGWRLATPEGPEGYDRVVWATDAPAAARSMDRAAEAAQQQGQDALAAALARWVHLAAGLRFTAITTVYAWAPGVRLARPMLALRPQPNPVRAPAQFVFDRGQLMPHDPAQQGLLAFVISASQGGREALQASVLHQAQQQLRLSGLHPVQTVIEKRATFACRPGVQRPPLAVAQGLFVAGDYTESPYPATLEAAVRSGLAAADLALARA